MAYLRSYGLDNLKYIEDPIVDLMIQENTGPDRTIRSQLDLPDAMQAYQEELINMRTPETRPRDDEQGGEAEVRERSRKMMNIMNYGDVRGDMDLAYKPEIEQIPQPYRTLNEKKYDLFQKDKAIHCRYAARGEAQKDDMMRHPLGDPKYKHSDTRKYIPGYVRTMQKVSIEDHEVPLYGKLNNGKPIQNYRNIENGWVLQYCKDSCRVDSTKKKQYIKRSQAPREHVENVKDVITNVNIMQAIVKGSYKRNMLDQDIYISPEDDKEMTKERARDAPNKRFVTFGNFVNIKQFVDMNEKVNKIEKAIKKSAQRPKLGLSIIDKNESNDVYSDIEKPKQAPNRSNTFILNVNKENISTFNDDIKSTEEKERKHRKQNRSTGVTAITPDDEYTDKGREDKEIKRSQIRVIMDKMNPIKSSEHSTVVKHHKEKQNLTKHTEGYNTRDSTSLVEFGRKRLEADIDTRTNRRIDESQYYDDKVVDTQTKSYVNKAKQNRVIHPDMMIISADPYVDIPAKKKGKISFDEQKSFVTSEYAIRKSLRDSQ